LIDQLVRDARGCAPLEPPLRIRSSDEPAGKAAVAMRTFQWLRWFFRYKNQSITATRPATKPALAETLEIIGRNEHMVGLVLVMLLAFRPSRQNIGFCRRPGLDFAMAIADRYRRARGSLRLNCRVARSGCRRPPHGRRPAPTARPCARIR